jgi:hypothetical protein
MLMLQAINLFSYLPYYGNIFLKPGVRLCRTVLVFAIIGNSGGIGYQDARKH